MESRTWYSINETIAATYNDREYTSCIKIVNGKFDDESKNGQGLTHDRILTYLNSCGL